MAEYSNIVLLAASSRAWQQTLLSRATLPVELTYIRVKRGGLPANNPCDAVRFISREYRGDPRFRLETFELKRFQQ